MLYFVKHISNTLQNMSLCTDFFIFLFILQCTVVEVKHCAGWIVIYSVYVESWVAERSAWTMKLGGPIVRKQWHAPPTALSVSGFRRP